MTSIRRLLSLVVFVIVGIVFSSNAMADETVSSSTPKVTVSVAEGYVVLLKNGVTPGSASTRFGLGLGWKLPRGFGISATIGVSIPNTESKANPRVILGVGYSINDRWSLGGGLLYQVNPGYGSSTTTNLLGVSIGPGVKLGGGFSLGFSVGIARCIEGGAWSLLFQPSFAYTF